MNPKNAKRIQALLWHGVPKAEQKDIRGLDSNITYIDQKHIMRVDLLQAPCTCESMEV